MPNFLYTTGIPNPPDDPSNDVGTMQTNANSISSILAIDHFGFNNNNGGWHQQSTYVDQTTPPVSVAKQLILYAVQGALGSELHMVRDGVIGTDTNLTSASIPAPLAAANGYTFLPGGLILQYGFNSAVASGTFASGQAFGTVTFPHTFQNNVFAVYPIPSYKNASPPNNAGSVNIAQDALSLTQFTWAFNSASHQYTGFYWLAVGN